jgi:hypothetical protein
MVRQTAAAFAYYVSGSSLDGSVFAVALLLKNSALNLPSPSMRPVSLKAK